MHFFGIVLVEGPLLRSEAEAVVAPLLEPFRSIDGGAGKWDSWRIGGRYTGALATGYDPLKDPMNYEPCGKCDGSGSRVFSPPGRPEIKSRPIRCEACLGQGRKLLSATLWATFDGDVVAVRKLGAVQARVIMTPDGEWHARGRRTDQSWASKMHELLREHHECTAVGVDFHL